MRGTSMDEIVQSLREASRHITMTKKDYGKYAREHGLPSLSTVCRRMGSWNEALDAAGIERVASRRRKPRSIVEDALAMEIRKQKIADGLRRCQEDIHPDRLSKARYTIWRNGSSEYPAASTIMSVFGSWRGALEFADIIHNGLDTPSRGSHSEDSVLDVLAQAHEAGIRTLKQYSEWRLTIEPQAPSPSTIVNHLGSWSAAKRYMADLG